VPIDNTTIFSTGCGYATFGSITVSTANRHGQLQKQLVSENLFLFQIDFITNCHISLDSLFGSDCLVLTSIPNDLDLENLLDD